MNMNQLGTINMPPTTHPHAHLLQQMYHNANTAPSQQAPMAMNSFTALLQPSATTSANPMMAAYHQNHFAATGPMASAMMHHHANGAMLASSAPTAYQTLPPAAPVLTSPPTKNPNFSVPTLIPNFFASDSVDTTANTTSTVPTEAQLVDMIDASLALASTSHVPLFMQLFEQAKTEPEQTMVLLVLRATVTSTNTKLVKVCGHAFEKASGVKIAKKWLDNAVEWGYKDLLTLLLEVLKSLPLQLTSITEAKINEPIVKLRKNADDDQVKRAAQDLLKFWRNKFTEKEKPKPVEKTASSSTTPASTSSKGESKSSKVSKSDGASTASKDTPKPLKKRSIKRLERLPFGGGNSISKSSGLIGNLLQRKSQKDAAIKAKKEEDATSAKLSPSEKKRKDTAPKAEQAKPDDELTMKLPTIQSFGAASSTASKKIRWADEEGKELVKVKLIESWRDMIHHQHHEESFRDAKLREHADERNAMKSHKEWEHFTVTVAHEWSTPASVALPESLASRQSPVETPERTAQTQRTRHEMEYLVLDGEIPPTSPKEWVRTNEPQRGPPLQIPLSDVAEAQASSAMGTHTGGVDDYEYANETEEEKAVREALGPLKKSTIALLMDFEDVLPQVYDEAQRNGNRIPDLRVIELIEQYKQQHGMRHHAAPPAPAAYGGGSYHHHPPAPYADYHHGLKRKGPPSGGGILADAPPPSKRLMKRGPAAQPCMYFVSSGGCKHGNACQYSHELPPNAQYTGHAPSSSMPMRPHGAIGGGRFGGGGRR